MRLRARLSLISAVVTTASTLTVGGIAINSQLGSQIALVDKSLNQVVTAVQPMTNAALSEALFAVQQSDISLTLIYYTDPQSPLVLNESNLAADINPSNSQLREAFSRSITVSAVESYRLRAINLPNDEYLLVAATLQEAESRFEADRFNLILFIFLSLFVATLVTWFFFRRDIKKIESLIKTAEEISLGESRIDIKVDGGNSEIDQLAASLNRMVATLRTNAEMEELANQRMQEFLGDASHELRTPLTVIRGYIELLAGSKFKDESQRVKAFQRVASEIARMESLINDLLFLAESGTSRHTEFEPVDLSQILLSHVHDFEHVNPGRSVELHVADSTFIDGSTALLSRLLTNILSNIARHTPVNAAVRVTLKAEEPKVRILIEDGGPGLPENAYRDGPQNFQRFDKSRSRDGGGSGLGMSIIFAIVQELGGEIRLLPSQLGGLAVEIYFDKLDK